MDGASMRCFKRMQFRPELYRINLSFYIEGDHVCRQRAYAGKRAGEKNTRRSPNESEEYRRARAALLAEEIDLRCRIERVAEQRRALPPSLRRSAGEEAAAEGAT
jgi:hypothetical protein